MAFAAADAERAELLPNGLSFGDYTKIILATDRILREVKGEIRRVLIPHEGAMQDPYPARVTARGHYVVEVALADGDRSRL